MPAETWTSQSFQDAVDALDEGKRIEIEFAIYELEEDPRWKEPFRHPAPGDSPYSGFMIDLSVDDYGIVYKIVDQGAVVELWYLFEIPGSKVRPIRSPDDPYPPFM